jgi:hypothetical protein
MTTNLSELLRETGHLTDDEIRADIKRGRDYLIAQTPDIDTPLQLPASLARILADPPSALEFGTTQRSNRIQPLRRARATR